VKRRAFIEAVLAALAGLLLYAAAAGLETVLDAGPTLSAILEELGKTMLLLVFGWSGRVGASVRQRVLGLARGLSLGLVAVTVFAAAENMAYLLAFQEAGVLARLLWSLPVHLVAALAEAWGVLILLRGRETSRRAILGTLCWFAGLCFACAWHIGANALASVHLAASTFAGGVALAILLFLVLMSQFLKQAYLGGFLHGAD
jgi:hypothetical protein